MPAFPSLQAALFADGPAPDRAEKMALYGWLIGDWEMDTRLFAEDGSATPGRGEIHFGWALQGRAIQDVWILPGAFFGTTLRIYDAGLDAWHILWHDPLKQYYTRQLGRAEGRDIVQLGSDESGATSRWSFREITLDAFVWRAELSSDGERDWRLLAEFRARRIGS